MPLRNYGKQSVSNILQILTPRDLGPSSRGLPVSNVLELLPPKEFKTLAVEPIHWLSTYPNPSKGPAMNEFQHSSCHTICDFLQPILDTSSIVC